MRVELIAACALFVAQEAHVELGAVRWDRDVDAALEDARASGKPVFLLFQEVPGCATCRGFGAGPLSEPLLVEAIEAEFCPVVVFNNERGADARALERFSEPSWNNPVVRFVDGSGADLLPRRAGVYGTGAVAERMVRALEAAERAVPPYLALAALEARAEEPARAVFTMHCFWEGEARLGALDGVVSTRCGWYAGSEVVDVRYRPDVVTLDELVRAARRLECARAVHVPAADGEALPEGVGRLEGEVRDAKDSDQRRSLARSPLRFVPLSEAQSVRVNAALRTGGDPRAYLSPQQLRIADALAALEHLPEGLAPHARLSALAEVERRVGLDPR